MSFKQLTRKITGDAPGRTTELRYYRVGPARKQGVQKVYLQAALHADEQPGTMVLHHLLGMLRGADARGELQAEFVVMPMVNPLGMANLGFNQHQGRYDPVSGKNFNRSWLRLFPLIKDQLAGKLDNSAEVNKRLIRKVLGEALKAMKPVSALEQQRHHVTLEAFDADYVFDLHCDNDALIHIFAVPQLRNEMQELADWIGAAGTLLAEDSGGGSFDEVWPALWIELARAYPNKAMPTPTKAATLEYRGQSDVFDALNSQDAKQLYGYFQAQGLITGEAVDAETMMAPEPTDLDATEMVRVDQAGLLAYQVELGDVVEKGQLIAELVILEGEGAFIDRVPVYAGTSGRIISRNTTKYVWPGCSVAKIVGTEKLETRGEYLLED